ncbi:unnamed protein product [Paramecium pentaurelia]|uniref:Uncharacterized protein n=1 Tax=Paramecium pentaurelia TaxID=43138 RepID=A0A8S1YRM0_9CILI|nr:unnamed protein product [Paramecium pentaurelia]
MNNNYNLAESSYINLEELLYIIKGNTLDDWDNQKTSYLKKYEKSLIMDRSGIGVFYLKIKEQNERDVVNVYMNDQEKKQLEKEREAIQMININQLYIKQRLNYNCNQIQRQQFFIAKQV